MGCTKPFNTTEVHWEGMGRNFEVFNTAAYDA